MEKVTLAQLQESPDKYKDVVIYAAKADESVIVANNGEWIPKSKFDDERNQMKTLENQIKDRDKVIEEKDKTILSQAKKMEKVPELEKEASEAKAKVKEEAEARAKAQEEHKSALEAEKKKYAIKESLRDAGVQPKYLDFVLSQQFPDLSAIELKDGKFSLPEDNKKVITETYKEIIGEIKIEGDGHANGPTPNTGAHLTQEQVSKMSQKDVAANWSVIQKSMETWEKQN
jgi:sulfur carrier protein ThiS